MPGGKEFTIGEQEFIHKCLDFQGTVPHGLGTSEALSASSPGTAIEQKGYHTDRELTWCQRVRLDGVARNDGRTQPLHWCDLWPDSKVQDTRCPQPGKQPPEEPLSFRMVLQGYCQSDCVMQRSWRALNYLSPADLEQMWSQCSRSSCWPTLKWAKVTLPFWVLSYTLASFKQSAFSPSFL